MPYHAVRQVAAPVGRRRTGVGEVTDMTQVTPWALTRSLRASGFEELQSAYAFCFILLIVPSFSKKQRRLK